MTPNTFEGITAGGKVDVVEYFAGYLWKIKPRNEDDFFMSQQAGAGERRRRHPGPGSGDALGGAAHRRRGAVRDQHLQHGVPGRRLPPAARRALEAPPRRPVHGPARGGRQARGQRGEEELEHAAGRRAGPGALPGADAHLRLLDHRLGELHPVALGQLPELRLDDGPGLQPRQREGGAVGAAYDFSQLVAQGLSATFNVAAGWNAIDPKTRASAPDQREYNLTVDARPPWLRPAFLQGWWPACAAASSSKREPASAGRSA